MTVLKPRTRRICVRLSEEEYVALTNLCEITGARSVSDLTRDAMSDFLEGANAGQALGNRIETFSAQLDLLNRKVTEIAEWIQSAQLRRTEHGWGDGSVPSQNARTLSDS